MKLGKKPAKIDRRTLRLARYLGPQLPEPPLEVSNSRGKKDWGLMCNDALGCCTISACGHAVQAWVLSQVNKEVDPKGLDLIMPSDGVIIRYYSAWDGYNPEDPDTDMGGYSLDVLSNWRKTDFENRHIRAFVGVNPRDQLDVKQSIHLFGGLYVGFNLPATADGQKVWSVGIGPRAVPGSWGGHAVFVTDYDRQGLTCITWGEPQKMTWEFFETYCDEAFAILSEDWRPPTGFDMQVLEQDLQYVTA